MIMLFHPSYPKSLNLAMMATSFLVHIITTYNKNMPLCTAQLLPDDPTHEDFYCGWDWEEANAKCEFSCPSGLDSHCPPLPNGRKRRCIAAAGCFARYRKVYWTGVFSLSFDREQHLTNAAATATPQTAVGDQNLDEAGPPPIGLMLMTAEVKKSFESYFRGYLFEAFDKEMDISTVSVQDQEYDKICVAAAIGRGNNDPTSTSLDMVIRFAGAYIPKETYFTDDQFGEEIMNSVNENSQSFAITIKSSSSFFDAMTGASAIEEEDVVEPPTSSPSDPPTRGSYQSLDIRIDPRPTGSFGIVFNVRTVRGGNSILLTGLSFVTNHEGKMEYEIYSKLGRWDSFVGRTSFWTLVASGETIGNGAKKYTPVLEEDNAVKDGFQTYNYVGFRPLHVLGDGGRRSFYITSTKRFKTDTGGDIPILFSAPKSGTDGTREYDIVDSNEELEVYEGDGVLDYPWPRQNFISFFRRPRGFIGSFDYERHPCYPVINFTGWPCPYVPKTRQPTPNPSRRLTSAPVTKNPAKNPTNDVQNAQIETDSPELGSPVPEVEMNDNDPVVQTAQIETGSPELGSPVPEIETNDIDNAPLIVEVEDENIRNVGSGSWKVVNRSYVYGLTILSVLYSSL